MHFLRLFENHVMPIKLDIDILLVMIEVTFLHWARTEGTINNGQSRDTVYTRHRTKTNKTQCRKLKKDEPQGPHKNRGWTQVLVMGEQHETTTMYSYSHVGNHIRVIYIYINKTWAFLQTTGDRDEQKSKSLIGDEIMCPEKDGNVLWQMDHSYDPLWHRYSMTVE